MDPIRVCVTGAAGQIAYSLLYSLGSGQVFGAEQRLALTLLDIPPMLPALDGVCMEITDCALPLVTSVTATADVKVAFSDIDAAFLIGSMPRREGMERKDLLKANVKIFEVQGKALDEFAKKTVKVLTVGNPANTNCLIACKSAPSIPAANFSCLTRLDQNRAQAQIALRLGLSPKEVRDVIIWGNHSSTQFPDVFHATANINGEVVSVQEAIKDDHYIKGEFIKTVQTRGAAVIKARKLSSAMSAAKAICDHMRDWWFGTEDRIVSMGVVTTGEDYDIPKDLVYSFPVRVSKDGTYDIVQGLPISQFARDKMDITAKELLEEQEIATAFLADPN